MRTWSAATTIVVALVGAPLAAQDPDAAARALCYRPRPLARCHAFVLTNAGGYVNPGSTGGDTRLRGFVDWGFLANRGPRQAFGASWFVSLDEDQVSTGPVVRYRRWLDADRSLDIALGTPVWGEEIRPGSLLGLVKYNPVHWAGVGLRPEVVRRRSFTCGPAGCAERTATSVRVLGGIEIGGPGGLALSFAGGLAALLLALALAGSD